MFYSWVQLAVVVQFHEVRSCTDRETSVCHNNVCKRYLRVQTKEKKHQLIIGGLEVREFSPQVKKVVSLS